MTNEEIAEELRPQYRDVKILSDGSVACLADLVFTRAILLGCDEIDFTRRFCFSDRALADKRWAELTTENEIPAGYVARRPPQEDRSDPYLNELHGRPWNKMYE